MTIGILLLAASIVAGGLAQPIQGSAFSLVLTILVLAAWGLHRGEPPNSLAAVRRHSLLTVTETTTGRRGDQGHPALYLAEVHRHSQKGFLSVSTPRVLVIVSQEGRTS